MCKFSNMYEQRAADVLWTYNKNYKHCSSLITVKQSLFSLTFTCRHTHKYIFHEHKIKHPVATFLTV